MILGNIISSATVFRNPGLPVLSCTKASGIIPQSERFSKSIASVDKSNYKVVRKGQLVIGIHMDDGVLGILKTLDEGIVSPAYKVFDVHVDMVRGEYLEFFLKSDVFLKRCAAIFRSSVSGRVSFSEKALLNLPIHIPSLAKQDEVLRVVKSVIDQKEHVRDCINRLDEQVKSLFNEMFANVPLEGSLSDYCKVSSSRRVYEEDLVSDGVPFFKVSDIVLLEAGGRPKGEAFITETSYDGLKANGLVPKAGDILITARGTIGCCYQIKEGDKFYFQDGMVTWVSVNDGRILPSFLLAQMKYGDDFFQQEGKKKGATVAYMSISDVKKLPLKIPQIESQKAFLHLSEQIIKLRFNYQHQIDLLNELLEAKMEEYFGGAFDAN